MAAAMPATPTTPPATTMPLPSYQVSGAGAGAAAPRHAGVSAGSSIGAFFGVLAAVLVLAALSCVFGRVCAAQAERPDESYDCSRLALWRRRRAPRRRPPPAAEAKQQPAPEGPPPPEP
ncbi:uncharacterized protein LOC120701918 [Panicum virgatum]|nr:uncharacterized protein LOC120701918 [Panicum virgatum]